MILTFWDIQASFFRHSWDSTKKCFGQSAKGRNSQNNDEFLVNASGDIPLVEFQLTSGEQLPVVPHKAVAEVSRIGNV